MHLAPKSPGSRNNLPELSGSFGPTKAGGLESVSGSLPGCPCPTEMQRATITWPHTVVSSPDPSGLIYRLGTQTSWVPFSKVPQGHPASPGSTFALLHVQPFSGTTKRSSSGPEDPLLLLTWRSALRQRQSCAPTHPTQHLAKLS